MCGFGCICGRKGGRRRNQTGIMLEGGYAGMGGRHI